MKNITLFLLLLSLLVGTEVSAQKDSVRTNTATVKKNKDQINEFLKDSDKEFFYAQYKRDVKSEKLLFEDKENKIKYYEPATKYNGEVSLLRVEERNEVLYKSLIYGWVINSSTPRAAREEAANVRRGAKELIQEKVKSGTYQAFQVKSTDSSSRVELRDKEGRRILEIADHQTYFHLIIFDKKWRVDPVDGLLSDFTIYQVIESRKKYCLK